MILKIVHTIFLPTKSILVQLYMNFLLKSNANEINDIKNKCERFACEEIARFSFNNSLWRNAAHLHPKAVLDRSLRTEVPLLSVMAREVPLSTHLVSRYLMMSGGQSHGFHSKKKLRVFCMMQINSSNI